MYKTTEGIWRRPGSDHSVEWNPGPLSVFSQRDFARNCKSVRSEIFLKDKLVKWFTLKLVTNMHIPILTISIQTSEENCSEC